MHIAIELLHSFAQNFEHMFRNNQLVQGAVFILHVAQIRHVYHPQWCICHDGADCDKWNEKKAH